MRISPFFRHLRTAYQAEMDDLTFDSEGKDVLRQRLSQRRKEIGFLLKMIELSPEMVAVTMHQGFRFKLPAVMDSLLAAESEELPDWASLTDAIALAPWTKDLTDVILKEPMGEWFLTVAACLEYMYGRPAGGAASVAQNDGDTDEDADDADNADDDHPSDDFDTDEEDGDAKARDEAGADWMVEQGFDRKD